MMNVVARSEITEAYTRYLFENMGISCTPYLKDLKLKAFNISKKISATSADVLDDARSFFRISKSK